MAEAKRIRVAPDMEIKCPLCLRQRPGRASNLERYDDGRLVCPRHGEVGRLPGADAPPPEASPGPPPETGRGSGLDGLKRALGGGPESFLLKSEGGWWQGEDGGVWVKVTRKQAAAAAEGRLTTGPGGPLATFDPPGPPRAGDFIRVRRENPEAYGPPDERGWRPFVPGVEDLTLPQEPPYPLLNRTQVVMH